MNETYGSRHELITEWLRILLIIHIASLLNSLISFLPISDTWAVWIGRAVMIGTIVCMFRMAPVNSRYKKAAIYRTVMLCCTLITAYLFQSVVFTLAASVFSIMAVYQEFNGHSELVADKDPKLSGNWHGLFTWSVITAVMVSFCSVAATLLITMLDMDTVRTASMIVGILRIPQFAVDVVYLLYLRKMMGIFRSQGERKRNDV